MIVHAAVGCKRLLGSPNLLESRKQGFMTTRDIQPEPVQISRCCHDRALRYLDSADRQVRAPAKAVAVREDLN